MLPTITQRLFLEYDEFGLTFNSTKITLNKGQNNANSYLNFSQCFTMILGVRILGGI